MTPHANPDINALITGNGLQLSTDLSFKTQLLYLIVFSCRYIDIFAFSRSLYNIVMKLFFFGSQSAILYLISSPYKPTWAKLVDTFPIYLLIIPPIFITLLWPVKTESQIILWVYICPYLVTKADAVF